MANPSIDLLTKRRFLPLFITQFFGAFNDNAFKLSMLTLTSYHLASSQIQSERYQALAAAVFILPFFLLSATAGQLADKYDKAKLSRWIKLFEALLMCLGAIGLYQGSIFLMMLTLTGMGVHSTFFGPIKYSILPDHLCREQLLIATGLIEASTFLAILLGTTLGTLSIGTVNSHIEYAVIITSFAAIIGLIASLFIPPAPSRLTHLKVHWNIWFATKQMLREALKNREVLPAILAISWFWLIGAVMITKLPDYNHYVLNASASVLAVFMALFSIGIALGSIAISYLLAGKITLRYVPITMLMLSLFAIDLCIATPNTTANAPLQSLTEFFSKFNQIRITVDFFFFSFCAGLFVVPLYTYLQVASEEGMRARTIAANNIFNALFMVIGSILVMVLLYFQVKIAFVFLIVAILNSLAALGLRFLLFVS